MTKDTFITLPLPVVLDHFLGRGYWQGRPISADVAEIILALAKGKLQDYGYHIQPADELNPDLQEPVLWYYHMWADEAERRKRAKRYSDQQRSLRIIQEANIKLVTKYVKEFLMIEGRSATDTAVNLVMNKKYTQIRAIGCLKLYETENEIP